MNQPKQPKQPRDITSVEADVSALRLVNLLSGKATPLVVGAPNTLEGTLRLTVADGDGNAMLERTEKDTSANVSVDGAPVFEIAHFRPMQLIETERGAYVMLRPYDLYLRRDTAPEERLARWQQLLGRARMKELAGSPAAFAGAKPGHGRSARTSEVRSGTSWRLVGMTALVSIAATAVWLKSGSVATSGPAPVEMQETIESPSHSAARETEEATVEPPQAKTEPAAVAEPKVATVEGAAPAIPPPPPAPPAPVAPVTQVAPVSQVAPVATKTTEVAVSAPKASASPTLKTSPKAAPKLAAAEERRARLRLEALLLESNYDPHGAKRQLEALSRTVPNGSDVQRDIRQAINSIQ